jgi:hypothetical protein
MADLLSRRKGANVGSAYLEMQVLAFILKMPLFMFSLQVKRVSLGILTHVGNE